MKKINLLLLYLTPSTGCSCVSSGSAVIRFLLVTWTLHYSTLYTIKGASERKKVFFRFHFTIELWIPT